MSFQQSLPRNGPAREALRERGQFWTPGWVAEAMVAYVLADGARTIFDPAVGAGAFFKAAKKLSRQCGYELKFLGTEIDPDVLKHAQGMGLSDEDLRFVELRDFVLDPPPGPFGAIVANPPYIRHHRLSTGVKRKLRAFGERLIGQRLDGRAGLHIYFFLRALELLSDNGRLAFIMPADSCEGIFAPVLWQWITRHYCLEAVVTFDPEASPFPGVDTNPVIFMLRRAPPSAQFFWARCHRACTAELVRWIVSRFRYSATDDLFVNRREIAEALQTGLSRPSTLARACGHRLKDFATVLRGIATGANDFFLLNRQRVNELSIPPAYLIRAVSRTRDIPGNVVDNEVLQKLDAAGRPTYLFCPDGRPIHHFPASVRTYLEQGQRAGLIHRPLIASRKPWYKMEVRKPPEFLFAYLGRRNARFVRNLVGVVPLTGFLCVYSRRKDPVFIEKLWCLLRDERTLANLRLVGKSYGGGCIKVEPRALEMLPLPDEVVGELGLEAELGPCQPPQYELEFFSSSCAAPHPGLF